jgi:hypothetical protein
VAIAGQSEVFVRLARYCIIKTSSIDHSNNINAVKMRVAAVNLAQVDMHGAGSAVQGSKD